MSATEEDEIVAINDADEKQPSSEPAPKKPSIFVRLWQKLDLDVKTLLMMFKGSIPPTVAIAMYQASDVASVYKTLGYLVAIASVLGMAIMPRGKFIQNLILNCIFIGLAAAINLLALYCVIKAREHTAPPGASPTAYNSSASAVAGVWLFVQIYFINYLRNARPQFRFPTIIYSIFCSISMLTGPTFPNMAASITFMESLMEAFLTGFALAMGVNFLILPVSQRTVVYGEITGYLMSISGVLKAQVVYMQRMETLDPIAIRKDQEAKAAATAADPQKGQFHRFGKRKQHEPTLDEATWQSPEGLALKGALTKTLALHAKINQDLAATHTEFAIGKIEATDLDQLWEETRRLLTPVMGLMSMIDMLRNFAQKRHWSNYDLPPEDLARNQQSIEALHHIMKALHEPVDSMTTLVGAGFQHILLTLELQKAPKKSKKADEENKGEDNGPGSQGFAAHFKARLDDFENSKHVTLADWCKLRGIPSPEDFISGKVGKNHAEEMVPRLLQSQLFMMLYIEYLILRIGQRVLTVILFAEELKQSPRFKRKLIFPGSAALYNWIRTVFNKEDLSEDEHMVEDTDSGAADALNLGQAFGLKKDPEHLPPANNWEKIGDKIRLIPKFFRNDNSAFGLRVAAATMSIAIVDFLYVSQHFFQQQRLVWALIMIAISMSRTAGQSTFNFLLRVFGTFVAMIGAYICYYIVDGKTPGVIVFLWLWIFANFYVVFKVPKYLIVGILAIVSVILIVGYELQVQKIGVAASESNGQPAYPAYLLAPYRLATVVGGLFVAWIWTIFPYPVSENSELRKDIAASLYMLANFYGLAHETVKSRTRGSEGDIKAKGTHAYNLEQAKLKVFLKSVSLLARMQENTSFAGYQFRIGSKFPHKEYTAMIDCVRRIFIAISLMQHASDTLVDRGDPGKGRSSWAQDLRRVVLQASESSHQVTSTLSLLSSSLSNGQPLPPYMQLPAPFAFTDKLQAVDKDILAISHMAEPEYSAVVVIQLATESLYTNLEVLSGHVRAVVGEMDFSFHAVASDHDSSTLVTDDRSSSDDMKAE